MTGNQLQQLRAGLGLSATELASVLFVHPATVHRWENEPTIEADGLPGAIFTALATWRLTESARQRGAMRALLLQRGPLTTLAALLNAIADTQYDLATGRKKPPGPKRLDRTTTAP